MGEADARHVWTRVDDGTYHDFHNGPPGEAWVEHFTVGGAMIDMPLFLREDFYVNVPLQATYDQSFLGVPEVFRAKLEKGTNGKRRKR